MLCLFLFHIDCTIYAYHVFIKKTRLTRHIELIIKYRVIWIPSVITVLSLRTFTRDVKVVYSNLTSKKKNGLFPSLFIGDNHGTVLELKLVSGMKQLSS